MNYVDKPNFILDKNIEDIFLNDAELKKLIPELYKLRGLKQNKYHAWDVWTHTFEVVKNTTSKLITKWSALLHDIGKYDTYSEDSGIIHFYDHQKVGEQLSEKILNRFNFGKQHEYIVKQVCFIVRNHMYFKDANDDGSNITDKRLRKVLSKTNDNIDDLFDVMHSDNISKGTKYDNSIIIPKLKERILNLEEQKPKIDIPVNGIDIIGLGVDEGPKVGFYLNLLKDIYSSDNVLLKHQLINIARVLIKYQNKIKNSN